MNVSVYGLEVFSKKQQQQEELFGMQAQNKARQTNQQTNNIIYH